MNYNQILYRGFPSGTANKFNYANMPRKQFARSCVYVSHLLQEPPSQIVQFLCGANRAGVQFFKNLARKFNLRNAELPKSKRESKDDLFRIFELVKNVTPTHSEIIKKTQDGFDSITKIFTLAQDNKSLNFVSKLQTDILEDKPNQSNIIIGILKSRHKQVFIDSIEQFKSYFKLNSKNENALSELEGIIDKNGFNSKKYDSELGIKNLMEFKSVRDYTSGNESDLVASYTVQRARFLWRITNMLANNKVKSENIDKRHIIDLYKSSNADNINLRLAVLDKFGNFSQEKCNSDLKDLKKLFKNTEKYKEVRDFVLNSVERGLAVNSVGELNSVIENVELNKANYFFDNVRRIVALSDGNVRKKALAEELENPFFSPIQKRETRILRREGRINEYGFLGKINSYLKNKVKSFIYNNYKSGIEFRIETEKPQKRTVKIINIVQDKNIQLTKEVNDIIKTKLGKRIYAEQEDTYRLKATKIRLGLLPDIFDSIKTTRGESRKQGIEPNVSNRDASRLYELINGANRKTVRYMLKICDNNGNRVFDVNKIIDFIEKANRNIKREKALNKNYRASDTKAYYENLFNELNTKYGKLKRTKKTA